MDLNSEGAINQYLISKFPIWIISFGILLYNIYLGYLAKYSEIVMYKCSESNGGRWTINSFTWLSYESLNDRRNRFFTFLIFFFSLKISSLTKMVTLKLPTLGCVKKKFDMEKPLELFAGPPNIWLRRSLMITITARLWTGEYNFAIVIFNDPNSYQKLEILKLSFGTVWTHFANQMNHHTCI